MVPPTAPPSKKWVSKKDATEAQGVKSSIIARQASSGGRGGGVRGGGLSALLVPADSISRLFSGGGSAVPPPQVVVSHAQAHPLPLSQPMQHQFPSMFAAGRGGEGRKVPVPNSLPTHSIDGGKRGVLSARTSEGDIPDFGAKKEMIFTGVKGAEEKGGVSESSGEQLPIRAVEVAEAFFGGGGGGGGGGDEGLEAIGAERGDEEEGKIVLEGEEHVDGACCTVGGERKSILHTTLFASPPGGGVHVVSHYPLSVGIDSGGGGGGTGGITGKNPRASLGTGSSSYSRNADSLLLHLLAVRRKGDFTRCILERQPPSTSSAPHSQQHLQQPNYPVLLPPHYESLGGSKSPSLLNSQLSQFHIELKEAVPTVGGWGGLCFLRGVILRVYLAASSCAASVGVGIGREEGRTSTGGGPGGGEDASSSSPFVVGGGVTVAIKASKAASLLGLLRPPFPTIRVFQTSAALERLSCGGGHEEGGVEPFMCADIFELLCVGVSE